MHIRQEFKKNEHNIYKIMYSESIQTTENFDPGHQPVLSKSNNPRLSYSDLKIQIQAPSAILDFTGSGFSQFYGRRDPYCTIISNFNNV